MIVIICGMHRSGTSALAGVLHGNGICMGRDEEFYPPPMKENPKGFYENVLFRRVNDKILKDHNYKVKSFDPNIPQIHITRDEVLRVKMQSLIMGYEDEFEYWGWKDPRTCLTLLSWLDIIEHDHKIFDQVRCVFMLRSIGDIATSMKRRGNREQWDGQFEQLAMEYNLRFLESVKSHYDNVPVFPIIFDDLIKNTREVMTRLSIFIGKELTDLSFIEPAIPQCIEA